MRIVDRCKTVVAAGPGVGPAGTERPARAEFETPKHDAYKGVDLMPPIVRRPEFQPLRSEPDLGRRSLHSVRRRRQPVVDVRVKWAAVQLGTRLHASRTTGRRVEQRRQAGQRRPLGHIEVRDLFIEPLDGKVQSGRRRGPIAENAVPCAADTLGQHIFQEYDLRGARSLAVGEAEDGRASAFTGAARPDREVAGGVAPVAYADQFLLIDAGGGTDPVEAALPGGAHARLEIRVDAHVEKLKPGAGLEPQVRRDANVPVQIERPWDREAILTRNVLIQAAEIAVQIREDGLPSAVNVRSAAREGGVQCDPRASNRRGARGVIRRSEVRGQPRMRQISRCHDGEEAGKEQGSDADRLVAPMNLLGDDAPGRLTNRPRLVRPQGHYGDLVSRREPSMDLPIGIPELKRQIV